MRRFFIDVPLDTLFTISGTDAHHISHVLRMQPGDKITVIDPKGKVGTALITKIGKENVQLELLEYLAEDREAAIEVVLVQGLPKSDKMDYIVQKAVELGVHKIIPMAADHSVVKYDSAKKLDRVKRWQKIAGEAAKQCRRTTMPLVDTIQTLPEILAKIESDVTLIMLYEGEVPKGLKETLKNFKTKRFMLIIGPEGGFSSAEVSLCQQHSAHIVTLGPRILRTETAAVAALAAVMYECGDLG